MGLFNSGKVRLRDANNISLFPDSRFDLAYNAAHSLALAALRYHGYRASNRYRFSSINIHYGLKA